jgi:hypothetical protein
MIPRKYLAALGMFALISFIQVSLAGPREDVKSRSSQGKQDAKARDESIVASPALSSPSSATATAKTLVTCVGAFTATGNHIGPGFALDVARSRWRDNVNKYYGTAYEIWDNSRNRVEQCHRRGPLNWSCDLTAEPCDGYGAVSPTPNGPACYGPLSVDGGDAKLQSGAENNARNQWQHDAGVAYGAAYKGWQTAHNASMSCRHNGLGPLQRRWVCTASGEPCR